MSEVNAATHQVRVKFLDRDQVESPWLDVLVRDTLDDKEFSLPSVGAQVACLLEENAEAGCVIGSLYSKEDAPADPKSVDVRHWKLKDGTTMKYDRAAKKLAIDIVSGGELDITVGGKAVFTTTGDIELKPSGLVKVDGAADFVALAQKVDDNFAALVSWGNAFVTVFNTHTVPTGVGPSGPPLTPATAPSSQPSVKCTKTKTT